MVVFTCKFVKGTTQIGMCKVGDIGSPKQRWASPTLMDPTQWPVFISVSVSPAIPKTEGEITFCKTFGASFKAP